MKLKYQNENFNRDMKNIVEYTLGFLDGVQLGKEKFLSNLASGTINYMKEFVDSMARVNPDVLHHVYEWGMTGSPDARLFDLNYNVTGAGISINSTFRQSMVAKSGSSVPFYDKARIMEYGLPVTISPRKSDVLVFEQDGQTIFTKNPVTVPNPGGELVRGSLERTLNTFIQQYFSQSFLYSSGIIDKIKDVSAYKKNLAMGAKLGKAKGKQVGYSWIIRAGVVD